MTGSLDAVFQPRAFQPAAADGRRVAALAGFGEGWKITVNGDSASQTIDVTVTGANALIDGLMHNWLLNPESFDLEVVGAQAMDAYLQGLGGGRLLYK